MTYILPLKYHNDDKAVVHAKEWRLANAGRYDDWRKSDENCDVLMAAYAAHCVAEALGKAALECEGLVMIEAQRLNEANDKLAEKDAEIERLRGGLGNLVEAVDVLIAESEGVYGLHLNGDPAPWKELTEGGQFEAWLLALEDARAALNGERTDG